MKKAVRTLSVLAMVTYLAAIVIGNLIGLLQATLQNGGCDVTAAEKGLGMLACNLSPICTFIFIVLVAVYLLRSASKTATWSTEVVFLCLLLLVGIISAIIQSIFMSLTFMMHSSIDYATWYSTFSNYYSMASSVLLSLSTTAITVATSFSIAEKVLAKKAEPAQPAENTDEACQ